MSDSLDLGRLADNLPSSSGHGARAMQAAEAELQSAFRNSAMCITQMLKAGQKSSKRAYQAGYTTALQDVLEYLQSSLDINVDQPRSNQDIAQVIDYIEARQQAAGLELQDIEAEDEHHHQSHPTASQSQNTAQGSPGAPQRMQQSLHHHNPLSFRNHSHRQQGESSNQALFRTVQHQQRHHQQEPVASTSRLPTAQRTAASVRSTDRSLSPAGPRGDTIVSSLSDSGPQVYRAHSQDCGVNSSGINDSSHDRSRPSPTTHLDLEQNEDSVALASSSSIPNSPSHSEPCLRAGGGNVTSNNERLRQTTPPPSFSTVDPSLSNASTAVTPMTRMQAKREREKGRSHDRRNRPHGRAHDGAVSAQVSANNAASLKRRWTASLLPEQNTISLSMNLGNPPLASEYNVNLVGEDQNDDDEDEQDPVQGLASDSQGASAMHGSPAQRKIPLSADDDSGMEMDDANSYRFDGNLRPSKRVARR